MTFEGTVQHGVIVIPNGCNLPEGTVVQIVPQAPPREIPEPEDGMTIWEKLYQLGREVESLPCDLPEDLAINHDHYLHGQPKRQ